MIENKIEKIPESDIRAAKVAKLPTRPNSESLYGGGALTANELKARFDRLAMLGVDKVNELIDGMKPGGKFAKTVVFERDGKTITLEDLFNNIFNGDLSKSLVVGDATLEYAISVICTSLSEEITRSTEADNTMSESINEIRNDISDLNTKFDTTIAQISEEVNGAFDSLIDYANSLANEVTE